MNGWTAHSQKQFTLRHSSLSDTAYSQIQFTPRHSSLSDTAHSQIQLTLGYSSLSDTAHSQTQFTLRHSSLSDTAHSQTQLTVRHSSLSDTAHSRIQLTLGYSSLSDTAHSWIQLTLEYSSLSDTAHSQIQLTLRNSTPPRHIAWNCLQGFCTLDGVPPFLAVLLSKQNIFFRLWLASSACLPPRPRHVFSAWISSDGAPIHPTTGFSCTYELVLLHEQASSHTTWQKAFFLWTL